MRFLQLFLPFILSVLPLSGEQQPPVTPPPPTESTKEAPLFFEEFEKDKEIGSPNFLKEMFEMLFVLGLMLGALLLISWFVRRLTSVRVEQMNVSSDIKILERRPVSNRTTIYLIDVYGERVLFAESMNGVTALQPSRSKPAVFQAPYTDEKAT